LWIVYTVIISSSKTVVIMTELISGRLMLGILNVVYKHVFLSET